MAVLDTLEQDIRRHVTAKYRLRTDWRQQTVSYIVTTLVMLLIWMAVGRPTLMDNGVLALIAYSSLISGAALIVKSIGMLFRVGHFADKQRQMLEDTMIMEYGLNWRETVDKKAYSKVRRRIEKPYKRLRAFFVDLSAYIVFNLVIWLGWYIFLNPWFGISQSIPTWISGLWTLVIVLQLMSLLRYRGYNRSFEKEYRKELTKHKQKQKSANRLTQDDSLALEAIDESNDRHMNLTQ